MCSVTINDDAMTEINRPVEALDLHLAYWAHTDTADHRRAMMSHTLAKMSIGIEGLASVGVEREDLLDDEVVAGVYEDCVQVVEREASLVNRAMSVFVSPDVSIVTRDTGEGMPPDLLQDADLPFHEGFAVFAVPWMMQWDEDTRVPLRALCWERVDWLPSDQRIVDGEFYVDDDSGATRSGVHVFMYTDPEYDPIGNNEHSPLRFVDHWIWPFNTWWRDVPEDEVDPTDDFRLPRSDEVPEELGLVRRQLLTLWRFMNEEVFRTERPHLPRPASRRWERAHKADVPDDGCLVSVHLRRYAQKAPADKVEDEEREAREVWWSHRFWVRGHKRFCKKCGIDHPKHKHEWVRPHLKPNDPTLPIVIKERLISVDR